MGENGHLVTLKNSMPIPWEVSTVGASGNVLEQGDDLPGRISFFLPGSTLVIADNAGFNLRVEQSRNTHRKIAVDLLTDSVKILLGFAGKVADTCSLSTIQGVIEPAVEPYITEELTWEGLDRSKCSTPSR